MTTPRQRRTRKTAWSLTWFGRRHPAIRLASDATDEAILEAIAESIGLKSPSAGLQIARASGRIVVYLGRADEPVGVLAPAAAARNREAKVSVYLSPATHAGVVARSKATGASLSSTALELIELGLSARTRGDA